MLQKFKALNNIFRKTLKSKRRHFENPLARDIRKLMVCNRTCFYVGAVILILFIFVSISYADTNVGGPIQTDSTWRLAGSPYIVNSNVTVYGTDGTDEITTLRIDPGVVVKFKAGTQLVVGSGSNPGGLIAPGTSSSQITFTAADTFQHWAYIYFTDSSVDWYCALQYCKIMYGGSSAGSIYCNSSSPAIDHCTISHSKSAGIYLTSSSPNILNNTISKNETYGIQCTDIVSHPNICGNDISNNGSYPIRIFANSVRNICSGNTYNGNVNNYIQVLGETISLDATWRSQTIPYLITSNISVCGRDGSDSVAVLTIEPGIKLHFNSGASLQIGSPNSPYVGGIMAEGTANDSIIFTASDTIQGWGYILFHTYNVDSLSSLKYCKITYGSSINGVVYCLYASPTIDHCSISRNKNPGIYLTSSSPNILNNLISKNGTYGIQCGDAASHPNICGNDISNNGSYPIRVFANSVRNICSGNTYSENLNNFVQVLGETVDLDAVWHHQTIPYLITSHVYVCGTDGSDGITVLTIEPGSVLEFNSGTILQIGNTSSPYVGGLIAEGAINDSIVFTASDTIQGWGYILFHTYNVDSLSSLKYCKIMYGNTVYGGLYCYYAPPPTIDHCLISHNKYPGIYLVSSSPNILNSSISRNGTYGIQCGDAASHPNICGNDISNNGSYPIRIYANSVRNICSGNTYSGNVNNFVQVLGETVDLDAVWHHQTIPYLITSHVYVCGTDGSDNVTVLTIEPGSVLEFNSGTILQIGNTSAPYVGGLIAEGAINDSIVFTASDTIHGWGCIYFNVYNIDSLCSMKYCKVMYGASYGNIYCNSASPKITHCRISDAITYDGIYLNNSSPEIESNLITTNRYGIQCIQSNPLIFDNQIFGNAQYGVYNATNTITIDADSNYWGDTSGPYDPDNSGPCKTDYNPSGKGDKVTDCVKYRPWSQGGSQTITITSPHGGETWCGGKAYTIQWSSSNIDTVEIEYSTNGGANWINIVSKTPSDGSFQWTVSDTIYSTDCWVKICDKDDVPCDQSDSAFTILQVPVSPTIVWPANDAINEKIDPTFFDWNTSPGATSYRLQVDDNSGFSSPEYDSSGITVASQNVYGLSLGKTYYWRVSAINICGEGGWSSIWHFNTSSKMQSVYHEDWEGGGDSAWSVSNGVWEVGRPKSGPFECHSGERCAATVLAGNYPVSASTRLVSPEIKLPPIESGESLSLRFWHWFDISSYDYGCVQLSVNGGTWRNLSGQFYGSSSVWTPYNVDLSAYADSIVQIGFYFYAEWYNEASGWYIDDITILSHTPYFRNPENWEEGIGDWWITNGVWEAGIPVSGPWGAHSGERCAATVLAGNYPVSASTRLVSSEIRLPKISVGESLTLKFWHWFNISSYDYGYVQCSVNGGTWKNLSGQFYGSSSVWTSYNVDLSAYADSIVQIGFYFYAEWYNEASGWYVDDIQIIGIPETTITVLSPNGGEILSAGNIDTISWSESNIDSVRIEYTTNGGLTWTPIDLKTPSDGIHLWDVPNTPSESCLVRICDKDDYPCDQSDSFFTITVENVTVLTPNGGEKWCANDIDTIRWSYTGVDSVKIDFSTDRGISWTNVAKKRSSDEIHLWAVPNTMSDSCLIRICDIDGSPCDQNDSVFSISIESVTLHSPSVGESWRVGSSQNITWESNCITNVNIDYSTNGGSSWSNVVPNTPSDGSYTWTIPDTPSNNCLIKICDVDGSPCDTSNSFFTITRQNITLTSPKGGESWCANDTQQITWTSTYVDSVRILYSSNNGSNWNIIIPCTSNAGHYFWKVPNVLSDSCRVKVCDCDLNPCDESDSNFAILTIPSNPTLASPSNGATNVSVDSTPFVWNPSSGASSYRLQVDDDSAFASPEYDSSGILNTNRNVYRLSCGVKYYWRMKAVNICGTSGWSGVSHFTTILASVAIISPNGGEKWCGKQDDTIKWTSFCVSNIKIDLSTDGGLNWEIITSSTPSDGKHPWKVPDTSSLNCLIKICNTAGTLCDTNDNYFTITAQRITVKFPNGGETFYEREEDSITWECQCFSGSVKIEYSINGGKNWMEIVHNTANDGKYNWEIPAVYSDSCKIKVSDMADGFPYDESDGSFAIRLPLAILADYHPDSEEWISYNSPIELNFSRGMDPTTFNNANISIRGVNNRNYGWRRANNNSRIFHLLSDGGFYSMDTITVALKGTIRDSLGRCWDVNEDGEEDCDSIRNWSFNVYSLGDYDTNKVVNGDDVAPFTMAWNTQDTSKDIGPANGTPPHLLPNPDGKIDFEELVIFVWMWNWFQQHPSSSPSIYPGDETTDFYNRFTFTPDSLIGSNQSKEFGLVLKEVKDAMVASMVLEYDPAKLQIESVTEGSFFSKDGANTIFLKSMHNESGRSEIACSRLEGNPRGVEGTDPVAQIRVKTLTSFSTELITVYYKIWDSKGSIVASGKSSVELSSDGSIPAGYQLFQNYPNPFNAVTQIKYALPKDCKVKLTLYNILGQRVKTLIDEQQPAGYKNISWDGTDETGNEVSGGIYFYRIETDEFVKINEMVILK